MSRFVLFSTIAMVFASLGCDVEQAAPVDSTASALSVSDDGGGFGEGTELIPNQALGAVVGAAAAVTTPPLTPIPFDDHDVFTPGGPLDPAASECAAAVCQVDPICCTDLWDQQCVLEALVLCP